MNKNKGFTLIELLGTIVIIGLLGTIAIASVVNIKKSTNARFDNSQVELMKQAGQTYFTDNKRLLPIVEGQTNFVTLDELIEKGYINKLYNSKKEEFDAKDSYVWVQKQDNGSYKYNCYCTIKGVALAGTTVIPKSEANNTTITFEYVGDFYNADKKHYTNGKSDASVRVSLIREEVSKYRYEIYKSVSEDNGKFVQYKVSQRDNLTASTVNIKLKAKDYSEGEYYILVTAYNKSGRAIQSIYSDGIYVDKTPPTCSIKTDYERDSDSVKGLWYSSNSENNNNQKLGENQKLPIYVNGSDNGSGIKDGNSHIFSNSKYTTQLDNGTGTYNAGNTEKNGTDYYATIEDNVGNKAKCSQLYYIDTTPPTCEESGIEKSDSLKVGRKVEGKQWYRSDVQVYGMFSDANSGIGEPSDDIHDDSYIWKQDEYTFKYEDKLTNSSKNPQTRMITIKDNAGNVGVCTQGNIYIDKEAPKCKSSGGNGTTWVDEQNRNTPTTLIGTCKDNISGCSAKDNNYYYDEDYDDDIDSTDYTYTESYSNNGQVKREITDEGEWDSQSPGRVYDEAGNSTVCENTISIKRDFTPPTCNADGASDSWLGIDDTLEDANGHYVTLTSVCDDDLSGCPNEFTFTSEKVYGEQNTNYQFEAIDNAGNKGYCSTPIHTDYTPPSCTSTSLTRGNGQGISPNTWYSINRAIYTITCADTGGSDCVQTNYSTETTEEGSSTLSLSVSDNAGNSGECPSQTVLIDRTPPDIIGTCLFNKGNLYPNGFWCQEPGASSREHVYHGGWIYVKDDHVNVGSITNLKVSSGSLSKDYRTGDAKGNRFCISTGTDTSGGNVELSGKFCDSLGNCQNITTTLSNNIGTGFPQYNNKCSGKVDANGNEICDCKYLRTDHIWTD